MPEKLAILAFLSYDLSTYMLQRRLFVGIPLSSALASRLAREMSSWPEDIFLKTVKENLHVTLFFLGFIPESMVPEICEKVRRLCETEDSFEIAFSGIRLVASAEDPKMVWLSGEPSEALRDLTTAIKRELSFSVASDPKIYRPHITLARIKKAAFRKLDPKPDIEKNIHLVEPVETVVVYESIVEDGERKYSPLESVPLASC